MNRTTAIFLALGILLAHSLSIHRDYQWRFAGSFDRAYLTYELGENLAQEGTAQLYAPVGSTPKDEAPKLAPEPKPSPGMQAYPSPLWVGLASFAAWMGWSTPYVAQMAGLLAGLLLLSVSTRIAYNRVAGVIPPLLLVLSGTMACGAVCGTEHMALALFLVTAFVAFEKNHSKLFAIALALALATRAESFLLVFAWFLFWAVDQIKTRRLKTGKKAQTKRDHSFWVFVPAACVAVWFGFYTPAGEAYPLYVGVFQSGLHFPNWQQGLLHFLDFVIVAVSPILLILSMLGLLIGKLSGAGIRALLLSIVWALWVMSVGGDALPFGLAYLPVFPLMCLAIQETIVAALDTYRPSMEAASWVTLFVTAFAAASASKFPGDVGPLSLQNSHSRWLATHAVPPLGHNPILGRTQLHSEIRNSLQMELLAEILDAHSPAGTRVLTPWPGHLSYQTELAVEDWFGRLQSTENAELRPTNGTGLMGPMEAALSSLPEVVLPGIVLGVPVLVESVPDGMSPRLLNMAPKEGGAQERVVEQLRSDYRLVALPMRHPGAGRATPYFVYQRKDLCKPPQLEWSKKDGHLHLDVVLTLGGFQLPEMIDLIVQGDDKTGATYVITPAGEARRKGGGQATLVGSILFPANSDRIRLLSLNLGDSNLGESLTGLSAQLYHPGVQRTHPLATIGARTQISLP